MGELEALSLLQDSERDKQVGGAGCLFLGNVGEARCFHEAGAVADHRKRPHNRGRLGGPLGEAKE